MKTLSSLLADRLAGVTPRPFFELEVSTPALQWLCSDRPDELTKEITEELVALGYVLDGERTAAGEFVRQLTTRSDRNLLIVRAQRGTRIRTLECFANIADELVLAVDDSVDRHAYALGYVAATDLVNAIARWIGILPLDADPEKDFESTLGQLLARATAGDGDVTLYSVATEDSLILDVVHIDNSGYFHIESDAGSGTDAALIPVALTSVSGYNVYLMLVDALTGESATD